MRVLLACFLAALSCWPAWAAPDAASDHKKRLRAMREREEDYWDGFPRRLSTIYQEWTQLRRLWRGDPEGSKDKTLPLDSMRDLYAEYVSIQGGYGEAHVALAASGHEKAPRILLDELLDLAKEIQSLEEAIAEARPVGGGTRYEQALFVRRNGLARREAMLADALAQLPGAAAFLAGDAWEKAEKGDRGRSPLRRTVLLDALGRAGTAEARQALLSRLDAPSPFVRIAALENLVPYGADVVPAVAALFQDPNRVVQRALCDAIRTRADPVAPWVEPLLEGYRGLGGVERDRALAALRAVTGQSLGDDPEAWGAWFGRVEVTVRDGSFRRPEPPSEGDAESGEDEEEGEEGRPAARGFPPEPLVTPTTTFYGVSTPSRNLAYCLDGTSSMELPADLATQTRRADSWWQGNRQKWASEFLDHRSLLEQQLEASLARLPPDAHVGAVHLFGATPSRIGTIGDRKPLEAGRAATKSVMKWLRKMKPGGTLSCEESLRRVFGMWCAESCHDPKPDEPQLDTVFLIDRGWVGGRWEIPEALVAAVERENRFRRVVIHTIRICDRKEDAEALMRGLAEATGGAWIWLDEVPAE